MTIGTFKHETNGGYVINIPQAKLKQALVAVIFAADTSPSARFALTGVRVEVGESTISFIATDGRRLALFELEATNEVQFSFTIPLREAKKLAGICVSKGNISTIGVTDKALSFVWCHGFNYLCY